MDLGRSPSSPRPSLPDGAAGDDRPSRGNVDIGGRSHWLDRDRSVARSARCACVWEKCVKRYLAATAGRNLLPARTYRMMTPPAAATVADRPSDPRQFR